MSDINGEAHSICFRENPVERSMFIFSLGPRWFGVTTVESIEFTGHKDTGLYGFKRGKMNLVDPGSAYCEPAYLNNPGVLYSFLVPHPFPACGEWAVSRTEKIPIPLNRKVLPVISGKLSSTFDAYLTVGYLCQVLEELERIRNPQTVVDKFLNIVGIDGGQKDITLLGFSLSTNPVIVSLWGASIHRYRDPQKPCRPVYLMMRRVNGRPFISHYKRNLPWKKTGLGKYDSWLNVYCPETPDELAAHRELISWV